jgi:hypothetical protein
MDLIRRYDLERPDYKPNRATRKQLNEIGRREAVQRAEQEAAARLLAHRLGAEEQITYAQAQFRVNGVYNLTDFASERATQLRRKNSLQSQDDPFLAAVHLSYEENAALTSQHVIRNWAMRP